VSQPPILLDEQGEPIAQPAAAQFLDEQGEPVQHPHARVGEALMGAVRGVFSAPELDTEEMSRRQQQMGDKHPLREGLEQGAMVPIGAAVGAGINAIGRGVQNRAVPMVRSALKPVWATVRRRAGIEGAMPSAVANKQAQFIIDNQLRTAEQADAMVKTLGGQADDVAAAAERANPELAIDSAERIPRYMNTLLRRVEKQILPGRDRAAIQGVGRELIEDSPLSRSTASAAAPETLEEGLARGTREAMAIQANRAKPLLRDGAQHQFASQGGAFPQSSRPRALRTDVKPSEALEMVRTKSFFNKDASGGQIAGGKAVERAVRDGVKQAVPATRPLLQQQGRAMDARELLDRATWRDANRDAIGLGGIAGVANGRPLIGALLQMVKANQLSAGLAAGRLGPQIQRGAPVSGESLAAAIRALITAGQTPTGPIE
jgi:hypothetical protein